MAQAIHELENGQVLVRCPQCGWERLYEDNRNPAGRRFEQTWDTRARAEKGFQVHLQKAHLRQGSGRQAHQQKPSGA